MQKLSFKLDSFEGPMDLLLQLIRKNKLNIYDIPISVLVDQYMGSIKSMREADMEIASEFLEMAAKLIHLKTISLLPKHEEAEELRQELTGQLLEYQQCQEIAKRLSEQNSGFDMFARNPVRFDVDQTYDNRHAPHELTNAYLTAVGKGKRRLPPPASSFQEIVSRKIVSVTSKIIFVLRRLRNKGQISLQTLVDQSRSRSELVATFLAVLELIKEKRVTMQDDEVLIQNSK